MLCNLLEYLYMQCADLSTKLSKLGKRKYLFPKLVLKSTSFVTKHPN
jgi:hypothetical protein